MRIQVKGTTVLNKVTDIITKIVAGVMEKMHLQEIPFKIQNLSCDVVFTVNGVEQSITVEHGGLQELFTVGVKLDDDGEIELTNDNSKESFIDDYVRQEMTGELKEYDEIVSMYHGSELELLQDNTLGDVTERTYLILGTVDHLVRYYKDDALVGELVLEN